MLGRHSTTESEHHLKLSFPNLGPKLFISHPMIHLL